MSTTRASAARYAVGLLLAAAGAALLVVPAYAPAFVAAALAGAYGPLASAWAGARGTELRAAVVWAAAAIALGIIAELAAWPEGPATGRPAAGHLTYLAVLAALAALISILGARTPGASAWALLMGLLVLVLLIPWLEAPTLLHKATGLGRLRLYAPWSLFYALLVAAGVTNYLPTRYGPAAVVLAAGFGVEYLGLARSDWPLERRALVWTAVPWFLALAAWIAGVQARRRGAARNALEATWLWFRDHWGVVWALRVQERFNRGAAAARWPLGLHWYGIVLVSPDSDVPAAAAATLKGLLRRFATPERLDEAEQHGRGGPCDRPEVR
jgi:hypothetical protein